VGGGNATPALNGATIAQQVGYLLGWSDVWNDGIGGTGYVTSGGNYTYPQRITYDVTPWNPNIVLFLGSINDVGASGIQAAALSAFQQVRAGLPNVPIIVCGIPPDSGNNGGSTNITNSEAAIQAAVTQFGDPNTFFIPINNDPAGAWIKGTGKVTGTNGSGNADAYISSDGVHPTDWGRLYVARKLAIAIQNVFASIP
jgi:lysophospholipase L1-like esterase